MKQPRLGKKLEKKPAQASHKKVGKSKRNKSKSSVGSKYIITECSVAGLDSSDENEVCDDLDGFIDDSEDATSTFNHLAQANTVISEEHAKNKEVLLNYLMKMSTASLKRQIGLDFCLTSPNDFIHYFFNWVTELLHQNNEILCRKLYVWMCFWFKFILWHGRNHNTQYLSRSRTK